MHQETRNEFEQLCALAGWKKTQRSFSKSAATSLGFSMKNKSV
jgi:hypothetical protein